MVALSAPAFFAHNLDPELTIIAILVVLEAKKGYFRPNHRGAGRLTSLHH